MLWFGWNSLPKAETAIVNMHTTVTVNNIACSPIPTFFVTGNGNSCGAMVFDTNVLDMKSDHVFSTTRTRHEDIMRTMNHFEYVMNSFTTCKLNGQLSHIDRVFPLPLLFVFVSRFPITSGSTSMISPFFFICLFIFLSFFCFLLKKKCANMREHVEAERAMG